MFWGHKKINLTRLDKQNKRSDVIIKKKRKEGSDATLNHHQPFLPI